MAEFKSVVITKQGHALMAKLLSGDGNIIFTKIEISDMTYSDEQLETLTSLTDVKQTAAINQVTRMNGAAVKLEAAISNEQLETGYHMQTVGLYANDTADDAEVLYGVMSAKEAGWMPPYNGISVSSAIFDMYVTVGNSDHVSLEINPGAYATVTMLDEVRNIALENKDGGHILKKYYQSDYLLNAECTNSNVTATLCGAKNKKWVTLTSTAPATVSSVIIGSIAHKGGSFRVYIKECGGAIIEPNSILLDSYMVGLSINNENINNVSADYYVHPRNPGLKILEFSTNLTFNMFHIFNDEMKLKCGGPGKIADIWIDNPQSDTTTVKNAVEYLLDENY